MRDDAALLRALAYGDPQKFALYKAMADQNRLEEERERCEGSFLEFFKRAWREIDSATLDINWHHEVIAEKLEQIAYGEIRNLIINIPPRCSKTSLVNIAFPAWLWCQKRDFDYPLIGPQVKFLCVSYAATLSEEIAQKMLRLVRGPWYQELWGSRVKILADQQSRANFGNMKGGERISSSIQGGLIGRGGDCVSGNVKVNTSHGVIPVNQLEFAASPLYILSYDLRTQRTAYRRLIALSKRRTNEIWRVHTAAGRMVETTREHPFLTHRGWVQAMALTVGDVLLSCVRTNCNTSGKRDGEVGAASERRPLLQPELCDRSEEPSGRENRLALPGVREATAIKRPAPKLPMRSRMQEEGVRSGWTNPANDCNEGLRNLRTRLPPEDQQNPGEVLLASLRGHGSLGENDWLGQSHLSSWQDGQARQRKALVRNKEASVGAGSLSVCDMRNDSAAAEHRAASTRSPHKLHTMGSSLGECDLPVRGVSSDTSLRAEIAEFSAQDDEICVVERICRDYDEDFYDLQIEGTACFFANDILVHNCIIIDDPHSVSGAESAAERESAVRDFRESLSTRVTDPRIAARILIMQRLHEADITDCALEIWPPYSTYHLMLPMRFDPNRACPDDIRTREGELLWPAVHPQEEVVRTEINIGEYAASGQYQQIPTPRTGGIIQTTDWNVYPEEPPDPSEVRRLPNGQVVLGLPEVSYIVLAVDTAMSEKETADWNACTVTGIWHRRRNQVANTVGVERPWFATRWSAANDPEQVLQSVLEDDDQPRAILMEAWRRRCKLNDETKDRLGKPQGLVQRILDTARRRRVDIILIENKTRGIDVVNELKRQMWGEEFRIVEFDPKKHGDKMVRAHSVQPLFSQGLVYAPGNYEVVTLPDGRQCCEVRSELVWVKDVMEELARLPRGKHDDLADCVTMTLLWLRENGFLELTKQYMAEQVRQRLTPPRRADIGQSYGVA